LILGIYSPLSIAAMPPVWLVGLSWAIPLGQVAALARLPLVVHVGQDRAD